MPNPFQAAVALHNQALHSIHHPAAALPDILAIGAATTTATQPPAAHQKPQNDFENAFHSGPQHTQPPPWLQTTPFASAAHSRTKVAVVAEAAPEERPNGIAANAGGATATAAPARDTQTSSRPTSNSLRAAAESAAHKAQGTVAGVQRLVQRQLLVAAAAASTGEPPCSILPATVLVICTFYATLKTTDHSLIEPPRRQLANAVFARILLLQAL